MSNALIASLTRITVVAGKAREASFAICASVASAVSGGSVTVASRLWGAARSVEGANRNARAYHLSGPVRGLAHLGLRIGGRIAPEAALNASVVSWLIVPGPSDA